MIRLFNAWWWKVLGVALILYAIIGGLLIDVPDLPQLRESIRNLFFHVPMWFGMILVLLISLGFSINYLAKPRIKFDYAAQSFAQAGLLLGVLGFATGSVWATYTWGGGDWSSISAWIRDPKILGAMLGILIYLAYFVLRGSIVNTDQRARVSAVYSVFGYAMFIVFIIVLPRQTASLHPGSGGNPGFDIYDMSGNMRLVFYPAVIGWTLIACWIATLVYRTRMLQEETR